MRLLRYMRLHTAGTIGAAALLTVIVLIAVIWFLRAGRRGPVETAKAVFIGTADDADCALLLSRGSCVMIDTGEEQDSERILAAMEENGVTAVDCMILTHPDKDHIGGAAAVAEAVEVRQVLVPDYGKKDARYQALLEQLEERGIPVKVLERQKRDRYGDLSLRVYPPARRSYKNDNDYSLAVLVQHGGVRMFFAGDAKKKRIEEFGRYGLRTVDLYKVAHHGRDNAKGAAFIARLKPKIAVVTAGAPEDKIAKALGKAGTKVYCTVPNRTVTAVSDGEAIRVTAEGQVETEK